MKRSLVEVTDEAWWWTRTGRWKAGEAEAKMELEYAADREDLTFGQVVVGMYVCV